MLSAKWNSCLWWPLSLFTQRWTYLKVDDFKMCMLDFTFCKEHLLTRIDIWFVKYILGDPPIICPISILFLTSLSSSHCPMDMRRKEFLWFKLMQSSVHSTEQRKGLSWEQFIWMNAVNSLKYSHLHKSIFIVLNQVHHSYVQTRSKMPCADKRLKCVALQPKTRNEGEYMA